MDRTIVVQLNPTPEQASKIARTLQEHTDCFNAVCREGFEHGVNNGVDLHKATYYPLRAQYPDLPA
jgi:putative transposase